MHMCLKVPILKLVPLLVLSTRVAVDTANGVTTYSGCIACRRGGDAARVDSPESQSLNFIVNTDPAELLKYEAVVMK